MIFAVVSFTNVLRQFIFLLGNVLTWAIIIRALLSWFSVGGIQPVFQLLFEITEPVLAPIRRILPGAGMIDFSPIIAIVVINIVENILLNSL